MLVVMKAHATDEQVRAVCDRIESLGYRPHAIPGAMRTAIGITGNKGAVEAGALEEMSGVQEVIVVSKPYKLVSRDVKDEDTVVRFPGSDATFGERDLGSSPARVPLNPASRRLPPPSVWPARERDFSAAAPTSRAPRHTPSRVWVKKL